MPQHLRGFIKRGINIFCVWCAFRNIVLINNVATVSESGSDGFKLDIFRFNTTSWLTSRLEDEWNWLGSHVVSVNT